MTLACTIFWRTRVQATFHKNARACDYVQLALVSKPGMFPPTASCPTCYFAVAASSFGRKRVIGPFLKWTD